MNKAHLPLAWLLVVLAAGGLAAVDAFGHDQSRAFLRLDVEDSRIEGRWDQSLYDLELTVGLDLDGDGKVTWGEVKARRAEIFALGLATLRFSSFSQDCEVKPRDLAAVEHSDGYYAALLFTVDCAVVPVEDLAIDYRFLHALDPTHRGMLRMELNGHTFLHVFTPQEQRFTAEQGAPQTNPLPAFFREGFAHIFGGLDHILFLVVLLLPIGFAARTGETGAANSPLKATILQTIGTVTSFTIGHCITLVLTTFAWVDPPASRWAHGLVAVTIISTAVANLLGQARGHARWTMGFLFGLIHGLGYSAVLQDLGFSGWTFASALFGFNLGIEGAQIVVLMLVIPLGFLLREQITARRIILGGGSLVTVVLAAGWLAEQVLDRRFMPF